jgi:hypothetical protein
MFVALEELSPFVGWLVVTVFFHGMLNLGSGFIFCWFFFSSLIQKKTQRAAGF